MTAPDQLYRDRIDVIEALGLATSGLAECKLRNHLGMAELWEYRIQKLTEQLTEIEQTIEQEEGNKI